MTAEWEVKALGEVCTIRPPKAEARVRLSDDDEVSFVPMEDLGIGVKYMEPLRTRRLGEVSGSYTYFADGDVLLAKITPCFENGKLGIARNLRNGVGFGSSEYIVFRPKPNLDPEFLYYYLARPQFLEEGAKTMTGAVGHKRVAKEFIESHPIPLPSVAEQRRIVAILDEAFESIATAKANAEKNLQNARELFDAYLAEVFCQQHATVPLSLCATDISDGDHAPPPKSSTGVPFITISNIDKESRRIDFSDTFAVPQDYFDALKPHRKPRKGDVLYTVTGSFGIPVLVEQEGFCFQRHIGLIRPKPHIDSQWLTYALLSPQVRSQAELGATGTAQRTVSLGVLRGITVPKIDLEEQRTIAKRIFSFSVKIDQIKEIQRTKLTALDALKTNLLHQAFTGQI